MFYLDELAIIKLPLPALATDKSSEIVSDASVKI
jgi:hypothetical protein